MYKDYEYEFIPYKKIGNILLDKTDARNFKPNGEPYLSENSFNHVLCRAIIIDYPDVIQRQNGNINHVYINYNNVKIELTCIFNNFVNNLKLIDDGVEIIEDNEDNEKWQHICSKKLGIIASANLINEEYYIKAIKFLGKDVFEEIFKELTSKNKLNKNLLFKIEVHNWGLKKINDWDIKTWDIYDDLSVQYEVKNGQKETKIYSHNINKETLAKLMEQIELAKLDDDHREAYDGEAWLFKQFENGKMIWERKLGYIYGEEALELVANILLDIVKNDEDNFVEERGNDMKLFNKKYDINEEDNRPQILYGIPDSMRKKWEEEAQQKELENKYNLEPSQNIPQEVYGVFQVNNIVRCPYCNSIDLWTYLYGEPTFNYDKEKYILGGLISDGQPKYKCKSCGADIYWDFTTPNINKTNYIRIEIKNSKSNYVMMLNHYANNEYNMIITNLNNLDNKSLLDLSVNILAIDYESFIQKLNNLVSNWQDNYAGDWDIIWKVKIEDTSINRQILGNGGYPNNWNMFIDLLEEYENKFKSIKDKENNK